MPISASEFAGVASATPGTTSEKAPAGGSASLAHTETSEARELGPEGASGSTPPEGTEPSQTSDEPFGVATSVTPAGVEVYYQAGPKRLYRVRKGGDPLTIEDWALVPEVTSVSTILGVLDKSAALTWWGMKVGVEGVLALMERHLLMPDGSIGLRQYVPGAGFVGEAADVDLIVDLLTSNKLTVNHVKDKAGDRGTNVHAAFEQWADDQRITPQPAVFPETERGYVLGLATFLKELALGKPFDVEAEVMVGSVEHGYAGRYDLRLTLEYDVEVTTKIYPKKAPVRSVIPAGRYLLDLKTSKGVYDTHFLQMEAYEAASIECGYTPTDMRAVVHVTEDGRYELATNQTKDGERYATIDEFLAVKGAYDAVRAIGGRKRA